jgi:hypothetical protein
MQHKKLIWVAFGLLLALFAVIQFIPDANGQAALYPSQAPSLD